MTPGGQPLPTLALGDAPESLTTRHAIWLEPPDAALAVDRLRLAERAIVRITPGRSTWHLPFVDPLAVVLVRVRRSYEAHGDGPEVRLALPTFARAASLLEALASLGIAKVRPVRFSRSHPYRHDAATRERLAAQTAIRVADPIPLEDAIADGPLWLDPTAALDLERLRSPTALGARVDAFLIGPEGGPTPDERDAILDHCPARRLGDRVLRTEVAAVTAAARSVLGEGVRVAMNYAGSNENDRLDRPPYSIP